MAQSPRSLTEIARRLTHIVRVTSASQIKDRDFKKKKAMRKIKPLSPRKGMTIAELLQHANEDRIGNAKRDQVTITAFRIGGKPAGTKIFSRTLTYDTSVRPTQIRPHKHWVTKVPDDAGLKFNRARVLVHCDCPDFLFTFEYALTHHGASSIKFSNGDPPIVKNPRLHPGVCKHIWVLCKYIQRAKV